MCLPTRFLKCVVGFNAWVVTLLGVAGIITGIVIAAKTSGSASNFFTSGLGFHKDAFVDCYYIFGAALLLFGVFGIVGGKQQNAFCLFIFNIFVILAFIAFGVLGIVALALSTTFADPNGQNCLSQNWSSDINSVALGAKQTFCQPGCTCQIQNSTQFPQNSLNGLSFSATSNYTQSIDCPGASEQIVGDKLSWYNTMKAAEETFNCAGWCQPSPVFQFSDSNDVPDGQACYVQVNNFIHTYGEGTGIASVVIAFVMLITILFSCCLCCHPEHKNKAQTNYYQRMAYYDA